MDIHDLVGIYALLGVFVFVHPLNISDMKYVWRETTNTNFAQGLVLFFIVGAIAYIAWPVTLYGLFGRKQNG